MKKSVMIIGAVAIIAAVVLVAAYFIIWDDKDGNDTVLGDTSPGHHVYTYDGIKYYLEIPEQIQDGPVGLIIDMHGGTMNAQQENDGTNMRELGQQYGYVILQPEAPTGMVNPEMDEPIVEMVHILIKELNLDEKRIHVTGFSMGGYLTWRFIRDYSDLFASAAPMSAAVGGNPGEPPGCTFTEGDMPENEIPILQLQGKKDPLITYAAGISQRDAVISAWNMGAGVVIAQDSTYKHTRHTNANGTVFEFIEHDYSSDAPFAGGIIGGHCFPGSGVIYDPSNPQDRTPFGCYGPNSFNWGEEVIKFFIAHPKS